MKKFFVLGLIPLAFLSCNKSVIPDQKDAEPATLVVNVVNGALTKADAYLEQQTYEKQVNSVQILVFDADGNLNAYKDAGTSVSNITITATTGAKQIWAVVNGPDVSEVAHLGDLKAMELDLSANSVTASSGFVMIGNTAYTVSNANADPVTVTVSRLLSRIALRSVTHNAPKAYGDMTVVRAFLQNVIGNYTVGNGAALENTWYNRMGMDTQSVVIDGSSSLAVCPTLTYAELNSAVKVNEAFTPAVPTLFYCYPNGSTSYSNSTTWSARKTALTIGVKFAAVDDVIRYYTVVLPDAQTGTLQPNTAYTVDVVITGLGSEDTLTPVSKSSFTSAITVAEWIPGAVLSESL